MDNGIDVVIADDDWFMRTALRGVLDQPHSPSITLVGEAVNLPMALALVEEHVPDVLIVDLKLRLGDAQFETGLDLIRQTRCISPSTHMLVFTAYEDIDLLLRALQAGASGYVLKGDQIDGARIREAIATIADGTPFYSPVVMQRLHAVLQQHLETSPLEPLTRREHEVLALLASGASNQQIADTLVVSIKTVKTHVSNILSKLQLKSRYEAALVYRTKHPA